VNGVGARIVVALVARHSNRAICGALYIGEETVKTHSPTSAGLHLADRTQAAICALRRGLVPLDE
jgi:DNA-binding NarL/FixJ family response regulator